MNLHEIRSCLNNGKSIHELPLRVTYYARVSTDKDEQLHSLSSQISYYENYIKNNSNWVFVEGYVDEGISGTSVNKRENFLRMISDAKSGKFDFIVTKEISRFSRSTVDSIQYTQELLTYNVGVLFQNDNINTLLPDSELRLTIMSSIAQDEIRKLSERVRFGFKRSIENGVVLGSNSICGYTKNNGKLEIDEEEAKMIKKIFELYVNEKAGIRKISLMLGEMGYKSRNGNDLSYSTIANIIRNPKYKGYYCGNKSYKLDYRRNTRQMLDSTEWKLYKDEENVPPIVSEEIWEEANAILSTRGALKKTKDASAYNNRYAYSGKIICGEHKCAYHRTEYKYKSSNKEVWQCREYRLKGKSGCKTPAIYTRELDCIIAGAVDMLIKQKEDIVQVLMNSYIQDDSNEIKQNIKTLEQKIDNIHQMKDKLLMLSIDGKITNEEFETRNKRFNDDIRATDEEILKNKESERKNIEVRKSAKKLNSIIQEQFNTGNVVSKDVVDSLIDRIEVYSEDNPNNLKIKVYFKIFDGENMDYIVERNRSFTLLHSIHLENNKMKYRFDRNAENKVLKNPARTLAFTVESYINIAV